MEKGSSRSVFGFPLSTRWSGYCTALKHIREGWRGGKREIIKFSISARTKSTSCCLLQVLIISLRYQEGPQQGEWTQAENTHVYFSSSLPSRLLWLLGWCSAWLYNVYLTSPKLGHRSRNIPNIFSMRIKWLCEILGIRYTLSTQTANYIFATSLHTTSPGWHAVTFKLVCMGVNQKRRKHQAVSNLIMRVPYRRPHCSLQRHMARF